MRNPAAIAVIGLLAACDAGGPSLEAQQGQSAQAAMRAIVQTRVIAIGVARNCPSNRYVARENDPEIAVSRDISNLVRQGYDERELWRVASELDTEVEAKKMLRQIIPYLEARGAKQGQPESACAVAENEIIAGSPVGRLLKRN